MSKTTSRTDLLPFDGFHQFSATIVECRKSNTGNKSKAAMLPVVFDNVAFDTLLRQIAGVDGPIGLLLHSSLTERISLKYAVHRRIEEVLFVSSVRS